MEILEWINNNNVLIDLFSTFVTALATVFYVILTIKLVSENVKNRRMQTDPKIVMDIIPDATHPYLLNFVIENIGNGATLKIGLVRQPGWLSPKSCKMLRILRFLSGSCSKTEVSEQVY
ncbi:MAG: hypothetical protein LBC53_04445 [Spirochaetaceae bacterium]|jgi:hypothetical protein|nr:hypothetical protein [Spirochaetaceae bacterium]